MGCRLGGLVAVALCTTVFVLSSLTGCAIWPSSDQPNPDDGDDEASCARASDCTQPPLRRAELQDHLQQNQERILSRDDYKNNLPDPVSEIIYGPLPDGVHRQGPPVTDAAGDPYEGPLNWHHIDFDDVHTETADHRSLRGRDASGAHCLFARQPNRLTPLFAMIAVHHPARGDVLYFGGPNQHVTSVDTVPLSQHNGSRLQVDTDAGMRCVFRDDQNQFGAVVIPFEYADVADDQRYYAVYTVTVANRLHDTGQTTTVPRAGGIRGDQIVEVEVPLRKYPRPRIEFVETTSSAYQAIDAAEDEITEGDFRLRPEFVYPTMPYQSYLNTAEQEFCPTGIDCETPPEHLDKDARPTIEATDETDETDEETDETDGE